jgi:E3 ubiquitin-protein ligase SIAH1
MSGKQIDWEFLKELECPVCLEYMSSPIQMCENGHNICGGCKERLSECPTCRGKLINVRNIILEKLAGKAIYPCKNREAGCEETFTLEDRGNHLAECLFQNIQCPFRKLSGVDCSWTGILSDISPHLAVEHESETDDMEGHFMVKLLDFAVGRPYRQVVRTFGELLYLVWETEGDVFSFGVFHFGPKNETKFFKYGIKIGNSAGYVAVTRECHSYLEDGLKDIQPGKCVTLHYGTIQECLGENGNLSCEIVKRKGMLAGFALEDMQEYLPV